MKTRVQLHNIVILKSSNGWEVYREEIKGILWWKKSVLIPFVHYAGLPNCIFPFKTFDNAVTELCKQWEKEFKYKFYRY